MKKTTVFFIIFFLWILSVPAQSKIDINQLDYQYKNKLSQIGEEIFSTKTLTPAIIIKWKTIVQELHLKKKKYDWNSLIQFVIKKIHLNLKMEIEFCRQKHSYLNTIKSNIKDYLYYLKSLKVKFSNGSIPKIKVKLKNIKKVSINRKKIFSIRFMIKKNSLKKLKTEAQNALGLPNQVPPVGTTTPDELEEEIAKWEKALQDIGNDAQLANLDLQNMLQKQQQTMQMMSNISKSLNDSSMDVIRESG